MWAWKVDRWRTGAVSWRISTINRLLIIPSHHSSESALVSLSPPEHSALLLLAMAGALSSAEGIAAMLDIKTEPELK